MAGLERGEERAVLPCVRAGRGTFDRQVSAEELHQIGLLRQVDAHDGMPTRSPERLHERRLADARRPFQ